MVNNSSLNYANDHQSILADGSKGRDNEMSPHKHTAENKPAQSRLMDSETWVPVFLCQLLEAPQHSCSVDVNTKSQKVHRSTSTQEINMKVVRISESKYLQV